MSEVKKDIIAIKQDMSEVKKDIIAIKQDIVRLDAKIDGIIDKMTVRFGIMIMGTLGLIKTAQSLGWW
jgi:predicted  nucleic acid-binding Zn-ribbon protein